MRPVGLLPLASLRRPVTLLRASLLPVALLLWAGLLAAVALGLLRLRRIGLLLRTRLRRGAALRLGRAFLGASLTTLLTAAALAGIVRALLPAAIVVVVRLAGIGRSGGEGEGGG